MARRRPSPLRVLNVVGSMNVGGAETYISRVARSISSLGVRVDVCTLERTGPLLAELEQAGVQVLGTRFVSRKRHAAPVRLIPTMLRTIADVRQIIRQGRYDIVHSYLFLADVVSTSAARLAGCRRIIVSRRALHPWRHGQNPVENALELGTNIAAHELIANSMTVLRDVERFERKVPRHRTVIYNGIDVSNYGLAKPGKRPRLELLTVGALAPRKGQQFVIEALDRVRDAGIDARLTMVGSGPDEAPLRELVNGLGLADSVVFAGEHLDPRPFLVEADIFVLPSRQEGFSNALLEAMASGLPAVVTDVGGNREALDGQGGRIVEPEQSDRLAEAILGLARTRSQLAELGGYNRARAAANFSIQQSVRHLADWYLTGPSSG